LVCGTLGQPPDDDGDRTVAAEPSFDGRDSSGVEMQHPAIAVEQRATTAPGDGIQHRRTQAHPEDGREQDHRGTARRATRLRSGGDDERISRQKPQRHTSLFDTQKQKQCESFVGGVKAHQGTDGGRQAAHLGVSSL